MSCACQAQLFSGDQLSLGVERGLWRLVSLIMFFLIDSYIKRWPKAFHTVCWYWKGTACLENSFLFYFYTHSACACQVGFRHRLRVSHVTNDHAHWKMFGAVTFSIPRTFLLQNMNKTKERCRCLFCNLFSLIRSKLFFFSLIHQFHVMSYAGSAAASVDKVAYMFPFQ